MDSTRDLVLEDNLTLYLMINIKKILNSKYTVDVINPLKTF